MDERTCEQLYLDAHVTYRRACLNANLQRFGYTAEQSYMLLGVVPVEGHLSGIVDVLNACCTLAIPTCIFDRTFARKNQARMPTYRFACETCGTFDRDLPMNEAGSAARCPYCGMMPLGSSLPLQDARLHTREEVLENARRIAEMSGVLKLGDPGLDRGVYECPFNFYKTLGDLAGCRPGERRGPHANHAGHGRLSVRADSREDTRRTCGTMRLHPQRFKGEGWPDRPASGAAGTDSHCPC